MDPDPAPSAGGHRSYPLLPTVMLLKDHVGRPAGFENLVGGDFFNGVYQIGFQGGHLCLEL